MSSRTVVLLVAISLASPSLRAVAIDSVVGSFYPDRLAQLTTREGTLPLRYQAFEETSFGEPGQSYVVATYTNGGYGAVRVLKKVQDGWVLAAEPAFVGFFGTYPRVELRDVTGDGIPEVVASFDNTRGDEAWIFQWRGSSLTLISPYTEINDTRYTKLTDVEFLDVDGDGLVELIDKKVDGTGDDASDVDTLYKWVDGHLVAAGSIVYRGIFNRAKNVPETETEEFDVAAGATRYQLTVVNGGLRGAGHRTSSAEITLNGVTVVAPSQFNQQSAVIVSPVTLQSENHITARVAGEPGGQIAIVITPAP